MTREELFALVWTEPLVAVAKRFDVSGSYLARVCSRLKVPRPARGYWAKLAVGKAPARPALPPFKAGDEVSWDPDDCVPEVARAPSVRTPSRRTGGNPSRSADSDAPHELIKGAKALFLAGRESYLGKYLKPSKRLLPEIHVTKGALDSALELASALFKQMERRGHRVTLTSLGEQIHSPPIDPRDKPDKRNHHVDFWSPARGTVAYVNGTPIGIAIFELTELTQMRYVKGSYVREEDYMASKHKWARDAHWVSAQNIACGRFAILAYASYYTEKWSRIWKEDRIGDFLKNAAKLAREMESCENEVKTAIGRGKEAAEAEQIRHDEMHRAWGEEQEKLRRQKALIESKTVLDRIIDDHAQRKRLEDFLQDIKVRGVSLDDANRRKLEDLIDEARVLYKSHSSLNDFLAWLPPTGRLGIIT